MEYIDTFLIRKARCIQDGIRRKVYGIILAQVGICIPVGNKLGFLNIILINRVKCIRGDK